MEVGSAEAHEILVSRPLKNSDHHPVLKRARLLGSA